MFSVKFVSRLFNLGRRSPIARRQCGAHPPRHASSRKWLAYRQDGWHVEEDGNSRRCRILPETRVSAWLIIARFRYLDGLNETDSTILWRGAGFSAAQMRRLRRSLIWRGKEVETAAPVLDMGHNTVNKPTS